MLAGVDRSRLVQRFGADAELWCDELPSLIASLAAAWQVQVETLLPSGSNSVVLQGISASGEACVLKLTPDPTIATQEAVALTAWASCRQVVSLLDCDLERGALLLELIAPGQTLAMSPDGWTLDEVAPMLAELWQPRPADFLLPSLADRVEIMFESARGRLSRRPSVSERISNDVLRRSQDRAAELATGGTPGLVHGDLHPGNVLRGGHGVVAIDPRPCWGDRAIDAVDWMLHEVTDERSVDRRIDWLARNVTGVDPNRVWAWCQAMAVIIAASMLARRQDDPVAEFLLRFAGELR